MAASIKDGVYECKICGNMVEMLRAGGGELVCCGEPMELLEAKSADSSTEKHVPLIEKVSGGYKVTVGSTLHPMLENHFIEWIELIVDGSIYRKDLQPGDEPSVTFCCACDGEVISAREHCNVHGLWSTK